MLRKTPERDGTDKEEKLWADRIDGGKGKYLLEEGKKFSWEYT